MSRHVRVSLYPNWLCFGSLASTGAFFTLGFVIRLERAGSKTSGSPKRLRAASVLAQEEPLSCKPILNIPPAELPAVAERLDIGRGSSAASLGATSAMKPAST